jgi:hypothetical protein
MAAIIPKTIHYCWLSGDRMPKDVVKCMDSWKRHMPEYSLVLWDMNKFDIHSHAFTEEACRVKKWAFAADYIRLHALYTEGGIYLDTDVFVKKSFNDFLENDFFTGVEYHDGWAKAGTHLLNADGSLKNDREVYTQGIFIQTAIMGGVKEHPFMKSCIDRYDGKHFILEDGTYYEKTIGPAICAHVATEYGFRYKNEPQRLKSGIVVYPNTVFAGNSTQLNKENYAVHCCRGEWLSPKSKLIKKIAGNGFLRMLLRKKRIERIDEGRTPIPTKLTRIKNILRHPAKFILGKCEDMIYNAKNRQRKMTFGVENPDLKFYVIGFNCGWNGLGWIIIHIIEHLEYADEKGYIPIVDFRHFKSQYVPADGNTEENLWKYWFEQPTKYDSKDILNSKNIIKSKISIFPGKKYKIGYFDYKNAERVKKLQSLYNKYVKFDDKIKERILEIQNRLIGDKRVLGIMCRGTDFTMLKPYLHPVQPEPADIIGEAEIIMKKYNCSHIFLSTEDMDIYDLFRNKFDDMILSVPQTRFTKSDIRGQISLSDLSDSENRREMAFSYLASMYILSKCRCFIGGITGGSLAVKIMSDNFEYEHFWDLGIYMSNDEPLSEYWKHFCEEISGKRDRK